MIVYRPDLPTIFSFPVPRIPNKIDTAPLHSQIDRVHASGSVSLSALREISAYILSETSTLRWIITSLHEHLNELAPISKLPDEILQEIFHCVADRDAVNFSMKPAVTLGVICRRWRRLVLDTSALWGRINQNEEPWISCALDRSRNAPLRINWDIDPGSDDDDDSDNSAHEDDNSERLVPLRRLLLQDMHRVKDLKLSLKRNQLDDLEDLLLQPSPMLEFLSLRNTAGGNHVWETTGTWATHSSNLRSLSLDQVLLPWPACASSWKKLVHLEIKFTHPARLFRLDDLIDMFAKLPLLETATFCRTFDDLTSEDSLTDAEVEALAAGTINIPASERRVKARLLRVFEFSIKRISSALELSRHLDLPSFCTVICDCEHSFDTSEFYAPALLSVLSRGRVATRVRIGGHPEVCIRATFSSPEKRAPLPSITLRYSCTSSASADVASRIWHLETLQSVRTLRLAIRKNSTAVAWADIAKMCTGIRRVVLETATSVSSLVAALENADSIVPSTLRQITVSKDCKLSLAQEQA